MTDFSRFHDTFGNQVLVQKDAMVQRKPHVWIFCRRNPEHVGREDAPPYLDVAQARRLIRGLERFIKLATSATSTSRRPGARRRRTRR